MLGMITAARTSSEWREEGERERGVKEGEGVRREGENGGGGTEGGGQGKREDDRERGLERERGKGEDRGRAARERGQVVSIDEQTHLMALKASTGCANNSGNSLDKLLSNNFHPGKCLGLWLRVRISWYENTETQIGTIHRDTILDVERLVYGCVIKTHRSHLVADVDNKTRI